MRRILPSIQTRRNPCCFSVASAAASEGRFGIGTVKPTSTSGRARAASTCSVICVAPSGRTCRPQCGQVSEAEPREEQLQVIGDLRHRADGAARGLDRVALLDGDGGRQAVDAVDVGLVHALEELARVGREGLDVTALALGVKRVEGERRFARAAQARDDGQPVMRDIDVDVLEIVLARAADGDVAGTHGSGAVNLIRIRRMTMAGIEKKAALDTPAE